ncbi:hypothetical protein [Kineococcus sp. SYSU DK001]|uniref:hypothetical protein n=1 Tax=Kineococcus sp. SYSU DK001 TaxID=3383122 RepID=UPI003D7E6641
MVRQRTGRGPLTVDLEGAGTARPRLYVRDGSGLVVVLPVPDRAVPVVRAHLAGPEERAGECDLELLDERGQVALRWGSFTRAGRAAALAAVLLACDRTLAAARVVARAAGSAPAGACAPS